MVSYRKGLPDITVPEQKYKASFYDDDNYNDRLLLSDIVQINKFKGYMLKEKRNEVSLGSILNESYNYSDANADNSIISTVTLTRPYTGNLYFTMMVIIVQMKRFLLMLSGVLLMVTVITRKYGFYHIQMIITM